LADWGRTVEGGATLEGQSCKGRLKWGKKVFFLKGRCLGILSERPMGVGLGTRGKREPAVTCIMKTRQRINGVEPRCGGKGGTLRVRKQSGCFPVITTTRGGRGNIYKKM